MTGLCSAASGSSGAGSIALHIGAVVIGTAVTLTVLISALETVVLPRQGFTRIARVTFAVADRILVHPWRNRARRDNLRALYAPIALVSLPLVWMLSVIVGLHLHLLGDRLGHRPAFVRDQRVLGHHPRLRRPDRGACGAGCRFVEAIIGLGLVALLISYLPTIYAAHHEREKGIATLRPFAGTPPAPADCSAT